MGVRPIFNLDALLAPISAQSAVGTDPRLDGAPGAIYFALKDARSAARAQERQTDADDEAGAPLAHWHAVFDLSTTLLCDRAKDLEVAAWLIEASLRLHGFAGLRDGFDLARGLVERYWDALLPAPDEDGIAIRVAAIGGLNGAGAEGSLIQAIRKVPLTEAVGAGPFAFWHYTLANRPTVTGTSRRSPVTRVTLDQLREAVRQSSPDFLRTIAEDLASARTAFRTLVQALDAHCGPDAPPSSAIAGVLEEVAAAYGHLTGEIDLGQVPVDGGEPEAVVETAINGAAPPAAGPIGSRETAFRQLLEVADYFRRTEPHSPLSYTLEDLVRRGRMSLPELLAELLPDQNARSIFLTSAGIRPKLDG